MGQTYNTRVTLRRPMGQHYEVTYNMIHGPPMGHHQRRRMGQHYRLKGDIWVTRGTALYTYGRPVGDQWMAHGQPMGQYHIPMGEP